MAAYFQLLRDGSPVPFAKIDDELCGILNVEPDPVRYYKNWYDTIGMGIAFGKTWDELREIWVDKVDVIDYLETYYTTDSWGGK